MADIETLRETVAIPSDGISLLFYLQTKCSRPPKLMTATVLWPCMNYGRTLFPFIQLNIIICSDYYLEDAQNFRLTFED